MTIEIEALTFETIIGILDFERLTPQRVVVTCHIEYNYTQTDFIDYAQVAQHIESTCKSEKFELLEEALRHLSQTLKRSFEPIKKLYLKVEKPDILPNCTVSLSETYLYS